MITMGTLLLPDAEIVIPNRLLSMRVPSNVDDSATGRNSGTRRHGLANFPIRTPSTISYGGKLLLNSLPSLWGTELLTALR